MSPWVSWVFFVLNVIVCRRSWELRFERRQPRYGISHGYSLYGNVSRRSWFRVWGWSYSWRWWVIRIYWIQERECRRSRWCTPTKVSMVTPSIDVSIVNTSRFSRTQHRSFSHEYLHWIWLTCRTVYVVRSASVAALMFRRYSLKEKRSIRESGNSRHGIGNKGSAIFGPRDELKGRIGLNVASYDSWETKRKELNRRRVCHSCRVLYSKESRGRVWVSDA